MRRVLVVGATSAIAHETAKIFAGSGSSLCLAARDPERLAAVAADLRVRGAPLVHEFPLDARDLERHGALLRSAVQALGGLDAVLIAHGAVPDQRRCEEDPRALLDSVTVNGLSVVWLLTLVANYFEQRRAGRIAVISSAAGERGRRSTYAYGMGKGLVTLCMQGLRARLFPAGVSVLTVVPCFIDTPMTAYLPARLRWISPRTAAVRIHRAMLRGRDLLYVPRFWRWSVWLLRNVPEPWFKRLKSEQRYLERLGARSLAPPKSERAED